LARLFNPPKKEEKHMENGTLLSHVDTDLVTREQLAIVETPIATRSFKPVPHIELVETLEHVLRRNNITIRREQFALRRDGLTLFGVLQLQYRDTPDGKAAIGLRTSQFPTNVDPADRGNEHRSLRQHGFSRRSHRPEPKAHFWLAPAN
jgi:hypothetical protein